MRDRFGFKTIRLLRRGRVAWLILNRPEELNAYNVAMRDEMCEALAAVGELAGVGALVLAGAGPAFSTGGDLTEFGRAPSPVAARWIRFRRDVWGLLRALAIPTVAGPKSPEERFAGAVNTLTLEGLMGDGRALQLGTSHFLGQNFAKAFDIGFLDEDGVRRLCWTTSWGTSYRLIGALIMLHGDDRGLRLPPLVAPVQVVVVPIGKGADRAEVIAAAHRLKAELSQWRVTVDDRPEYTPGWKYNDWEMRGVPLRVELGPRDLAAGSVVLVRRDTGEKESVARDGLGDPDGAVARTLGDIQQNLYRQAEAFRASISTVADDCVAVQARGTRGLFWSHWCGDAECEARVKQETGATIRCLPSGGEWSPEGAEAEGPCLGCGRPATITAVFARAY